MRISHNIILQSISGIGRTEKGVVWLKSQYSKRLLLWHNLIDTFLWRSFYNWLSFLWRYLSDIFIFFHVFQITNFENILTSIIILSVITQFRQKFFKRQGYNMAIFAQMVLFSGNIIFIIFGETIKIRNINNKQKVEMCASFFYKSSFISRVFKNHNQTVKTCINHFHDDTTKVLCLSYNFLWLLYFRLQTQMENNCRCIHNWNVLCENNFFGELKNCVCFLI